MAAAKAMAVYANEPALDYYRRALALCPTDDDRRWEILLQQADVYNRVGQYSNAIAIYQEVIEKGQTDGQARAYRGLAQIYRVRRDYDTARRCVAESRRLSVEANRPNINAGNDQNPQALRVLGEIEREQSNYTRAQTLFEAALNIYRNRKDTHGLADCYKGLGAILSAQGRYEAAIHRYQQATTIYRRFNDRPNVSVCLRGIGMANWRLRNYEASREASQESLMICSAIGDRLGEAASLNALGLVAIAQGDQRETQRCWTASVAIYQDLNLPKRTAPGLHNLGIYYMDVGEMTASRRCLEQALEINEATGSRRDQALDLGWLGKLHWLMGEYTIAARYLDRALSLDKEVGGAEEEDWHLIWRTAVACERQNLEAAEVYLKKAKRLSAQDSPNLKSYEVTRWCAAIKLAQGKIRSARRIGLKALKKAREEGANPSALGEILTLMGQIAGSDPWSEGRTSKEYFEEALLLLPDAVPTMYLRAIALFHYGDSLIKKGVEDAEGYVREAERIFERLGISMASIKRLGV
jgi:tetratricopeptide (TPR) repeat protein